MSKVGLILDGGTLDSIPIRCLQDRGNNKQIVVVTRNDGYVKKQNLSVWHTVISINNIHNWFIRYKIGIICIMIL